MNSEICKVKGPFKFGFVRNFYSCVRIKIIYESLIIQPWVNLTDNPGVFLSCAHKMNRMARSGYRRRNYNGAWRCTANYILIKYRPEPLSFHTHFVSNWFKHRVVENSYNSKFLSCNSCEHNIISASNVPFRLRFLTEVKVVIPIALSKKSLSAQRSTFGPFSEATGVYPLL